MTSDGALGGGMDTFRHQGLTFDVRDGGPAEGEVVLLLHGFPQDATETKDSDGDGVGDNSVRPSSHTPTLPGRSR